MTGKAHDIATGGFTLGGGVIAGTVLGALAAAGIARGLNVVRGTDKSWVGWRAEALTPVLRSALLRYLAVAHFGRGRGNWAEGEAPSHWAPVVDAALAARAKALTELWQRRSDRDDNPGEADSLAADLQPISLRPRAKRWKGSIRDSGRKIRSRWRTATADFSQLDARETFDCSTLDYRISANPAIQSASTVRQVSVSQRTLATATRHPPNGGLGPPLGFQLTIEIRAGATITWARHRK